MTLNSANQIADPGTDQIVWNDSPLLIGASGGGISRLFNRPSYQHGFTVPDRRTVPDVSMLADPLPGYEIYCTAHGDCVRSSKSDPWITFGGTSAASPLLAGGFALVDQSLRRSGHVGLGFANPLLYQIARSSKAAGVLSDVISGSNDLGPAVFHKPTGCCSAATGYDPTSGLGSVNVGALAFASLAIVPLSPSIRLSLPRRQRPLATRHLLATLSCTSRCVAGAVAGIQVGRSRHRIPEESDLSVIPRGGHRTIRIGLSSRTIDSLRGDLRRHQRVTAYVFGADVDPADNIERRTRTVTLRVQS